MHGPDSTLAGARPLEALPLRLVVTALAYALVGAATVLFSLRFGIPSPIFPPAGIATGAVLVWGPAVLPGVLGGRMLLSLITTGTFGPGDYQPAFEAVLALGATLQAGTAGLLARRLLGVDPPLDSGPAVLALLALLGPATCWIAPSVGVPALVSFGRVPPGDLGYVFFKWWAGDSLGAIWTAPMFLPLFAQPRERWRRRSAGVLVPLVSCLLLLSLLLGLVTERDKRRVAERFEHDVGHVAAELAQRLAQIEGAARALAAGAGSDAAQRAATARTVLAVLPAGTRVAWDGGAGGAGAGRVVARAGEPPAATLQVPLPVAAPHEAMHLCVLDAQVTPPRPLADGPGCAPPARALSAQRTLALQGRPLLLRAWARPDYAAQDRALGVWAVDAMALLGSAFVIAFVMLGSGRAERLALARQRAETESRARADFLSHMSHELRTPLNAVLGFVQLLRSHPDADAAQRDAQLARVESAGWHLVRLIDDILLLSRLEAHAQPVRAAPVDLGAAARAALALVEPDAARRGIALHLEADEPAFVAADPVHVQQVVLNLLSNAVKYNRPRGEVRVRLPARAGLRGLEVADTGPGLTPAQMEGLFIPFNRLGQEHSGTSGTGIGLTISRRLAERMGGRIEVASTPGRGARFTLWLPAVPVPSGPALPAEMPARTSAEPGLHGRLLLVEDNEVNVALMEAVFGDDAGISLEVLGRAGPALERLAAGGVDLVLLDLGLPDMDGLLALRRMVEGGARVVVVSADAEPEVRERVLALGALDLLPKPFEVAAMRAAVRRALAAAPGAPSH